MSEAKLPDATHTARLLSELLAAKVAGEATASADSVTNPVTAIYTDEQGNPIAACICDLKLAACLSAAFTLIPAAVALEAATDGSLPENLSDNLYEILNIASQLFRSAGSKHRILFGAMYLPGQAVPDDVAAKLEQATESLHIETTISNYTTAIMTVVVI